VCYLGKSLSNINLDRIDLIQSDLHMPFGPHNRVGAEWVFIWALGSGIGVSQVESRTGVVGLCEKMYKFSPADVDQESGLGYIAGPAVDGWDMPVELEMDASILRKSGKAANLPACSDFGAAGIVWLPTVADWGCVPWAMTRTNVHPWRRPPAGQHGS